ncbi:MAG: hypothetical protein ACLFWL_06440 [Candidatus Brocadiia bacterium]
MKTNPVETIQELYFNGKREVPYPVFMRCFDKLLVNPPDLEPAEPTEELKTYFHSVCLAIDRGIADSQDRGKDRKKEFYESILPVWKEKLPRADFREYEDILEGALKERLDKQRHEEEQEEADLAEKRREEAESASQEEMHAKFAQLMEKALEEEELQEKAEAEESALPSETAGVAEEPPSEQAIKDTEPKSEEPSEEKAAVVEEKKEEKEKTDYGNVPLVKSVDILGKAFADGKLPIRYTDLEEKNAYARYPLGDYTVLVQIVKTPNSYYLMLKTSIGTGGNAEAAEKAQETLQGLGYQQNKPRSFRRTEGESTFKLKFSKKTTFAACKRTTEFTPDVLAELLHKVHADLAEIVMVFDNYCPPGKERN